MSMVLYRVEKTRNYTVMSNEHLMDPALSFKAKGLLSILLSLPDDWEISVVNLAELSTDGIASVKAGMKELGDAGYITKAKMRGDGGTFGGWEYTVREAPIDANCTESRKSTLGAPKVEKPTAENRLSAPFNKILLPPIVPQKGDAKKKRKKPSESTPAADWRPEAFAAWYAAYPRHVGRETARKAWNKLGPSDELIREMMEALESQKRSEEWGEDGGKYIPHPSTYINQQRWTDELTPAEDAETEEEEGIVEW